MLGAAPTASDPHARPALQRPAELLASGRPADAADALRAVVSDTPTYAAAFVLLGVALDAAGRPDEALAAWHRAAFLVPNSPLVLRERDRLLAAAAAAETPAEEPAPPERLEAPTAEALTEAVDGSETRSPDPVADEPEVAHAVEWAGESAGFDSETIGTQVEHDASAETSGTVQATAEPAAAPAKEPGDDAEEDTLLAAPLDDFIFADALPVPDDDRGFDPDSFDFSAFDADDDPDWLAEQAADASPTGSTAADLGASGFSKDEDAFVPPDDLADWAEMPDADVRLLSPETEAAAPETPDEAASDEAVFQDVPDAAPASPLDAPVSETLTFETPPAAAAWAPDPPSGASSVADELDSLIASLETAPRIRPDPAFSGPVVRTTEADVDAVASETLARIYAAQNQYARAALVYETLAAREPARADEMLAQAAEMRRRK